jgi:predicted nucleic acid-binding protein
MSFLCDTNIISEIMKPKPCLSVQLWLAEQDSLCLSVISVEEIIFGLEAKQAIKKLAWFKRLLNQSCEVLPVSCEIANYCGELRAALRRRGIARSQADSLIAATAYIHDKILVTRNVKDFIECNIEILNPFDDLV